MPPGDQDFQTADGNATVATRAYCKPKAGPAFLDELIIKETLGAHAHAGTRTSHAPRYPTTAAARATSTFPRPVRLLARQRPPAPCDTTAPTA